MTCSLGMLATGPWYFPGTRVACRGGQERGDPGEASIDPNIFFPRHGTFQWRLGMRRILTVALLTGTLFFCGCFFSREFSNFKEETCQQLDWLCDSPIMDISYLNGLNQNTTRSDMTFQEISWDMDRAWKDLYLQNKPAPPISLIPADRDTVDSYYIHIKKTDTAPPSRITIERIQESDIMIIRDPDGRITVTNRLEEVEQEG